MKNESIFKNTFRCYSHCIYLCAMQRVLKEINAVTILLFPALMLLYFVAHTLAVVNGVHTFESSGTLNLGVWGNFALSKTLDTILCTLFVLANALLLNDVFNKRNFVDRETALPGLVYIILMSNTSEYYVFSGSLVFHLFFILAIRQFSKLSLNQSNKAAVFNLGLLLGVATTFSPYFYVFLPFLYLVTLIVIPFNFRHLMLYFTGWILPLFYVVPFVIYLHQFSLEFIANLFEYNYQLPFNYFFNVMMIAIFAIITIIGGWASVGQMRNKFRSFVIALLVTIIFTFILIFLAYFMESMNYFHFLILLTAFIFPITLLKIQNEFLYTLTFYAILIYSFTKYFFS